MAPGTRHVVIVQGHPDPQHRHFCHALADAYASGAREAGHDVLTVDVARAGTFIHIRRKNTLSLSGIRPIRESLIGLVEAPDGRRREQWLSKMSALGRRAA